MPSTLSQIPSASFNNLFNLNFLPGLESALIRAYGVDFHRGASIKLLISAEGIAQFGPAYNLIEAKVVLQTEKPEFKIELPAFVACGRRIRENMGNEVNLVELFDSLLPTSGGIGLFTCQNGIQCNVKDLEVMCESITKKLSDVGKKPLFIGLHNPTAGKIIGIGNDLLRLTERPELNFKSIVTLRQMFVTFSKMLSQLRPRLQWVHIAHSEAGLLANRTLTNPMWGLSRTEKALVKEHLITLVYGGVAAIPNSAVYQAINNYSREDIALLYAQPYLDRVPKPKSNGDSFESATELYRRSDLAIELAQIDKKGPYIESYPYTFTKDDHTITVLECTSEGLLPLVGDHFFSEKTYQKALENNLNDLEGRILD